MSGYEGRDTEFKQLTLKIVAKKVKLPSLGIFYDPQVSPPLI